MNGPVEPAAEVQTCAESLLNAGVCCKEDCTATAQWAMLDDQLVEHARCGNHLYDGGRRMAAKRLQWEPDWAPSDG